jgi:glycosyltransferase involved in cell wall biosynthesis
VRWLDADGAAAWNAAGALAPDDDLILLSDDTELDARALADLQAVARAEPDAATVTPLSNNGGLLSVPRRNLSWPLPPSGLTVAAAAEQVRAGSLRLHPRIPTALPHATLVAAPARRLVGRFDEALAPREALADFCARATAAGHVHVAADEVFVGYRSTEQHPAADWPGAAAERHTALAPAVAEAAQDRHSALARALLAVSVSLDPLHVTLDARALGGGVSGTTVHLVELLGALSARPDLRVRVIVPDGPINARVERALKAMTGLELVPETAVADGAVGRTHVVHRPWQVESIQDMAFLDALGERTVITQQDLIGYRTPTAFPSPEAWLEYRRTTANALALASVVLFFSPAAGADAAGDDQGAPEPSPIAPLGAQGVHLALEPAARRPDRLPDPGRPFLLVLGTRFRHKNVRFALELLDHLRGDHGWDGDVVLAGAEVLHGSGSGEDAAWQLAHPAVAPHVVELGAVDEDEKAWLLREAAAVVYASTYEGFGLLPFEAAAAGTPCLLAPVSALRDTIPPELAVLAPWDAAASAARVVGLLRDGHAAGAFVTAMREAGAGLTWEGTGAAVAAAYRDAVALPAPPTARLAADLARAEHDYWSVRDGVPDDLWTLVRPDAPQLDEPLARDLSGMLTAPAGRRRLLRALSIARRLPFRD